VPRGTASGPRIKSGDTAGGWSGLRGVSAKASPAGQAHDCAPAGQAAPAESLRPVSAKASPAGQAHDCAPAGQAAPAEAPRAVSAIMTESEGWAGLATRLVFVQESAPGCMRPTEKEQ